MKVRPNIKPKTNKGRIAKLLIKAHNGDYITPNHINWVPEHDFESIPNDQPEQSK